LVVMSSSSTPLFTVPSGRRGVKVGGRDRPRWAPPGEAPPHHRRIAIVVIVPALGVWVGSSLAAYLNGPVGLAFRLAPARPAPSPRAEDAPRGGAHHRQRRPLRRRGVPRASEDGTGPRPRTARSRTVPLQAGRDVPGGDPHGLEPLRPLRRGRRDRGAGGSVTLLPSAQDGSEPVVVESERGRLRRRGAGVDQDSDDTERPDRAEDVDVRKR